MAKIIPATIGPMDSYCWYDPACNKFKVRFRMEMVDHYNRYYEAVVVSISLEVLCKTAEGQEYVQCNDPDKVRWTRVSEASIDETK